MLAMTKEITLTGTIIATNKFNELTHEFPRQRSLFNKQYDNI